MKLYFTDSRGNKKLIAEDIKTVEESTEAILKHQASFFIHPKGAITFHRKDEKTMYAKKDNKTTGYTIEE